MYLNHPDLRKYWVIDVEGDGLYPSKLWCLVACNAATGELRKFIGHAEIKRFFRECPSGTIFVGHNCISYDVPNCNRLCDADVLYDSVVDTLVLSYLFNPSLNGHSLESWAIRLRLPYQKVIHEDWSQYSEDMLERCVTDVLINRELFLRLTKKMRSYGYSELSCQIEHQIRRIIDVQQSNGFYFNIHGAEELLRDLRRRQADLAEPIQRLFPPVLVPVKELKLRRTKGGVPHKSYLKNVARHSKVEIEGEYYKCYDWQEFNIGSPKQRLEKLLQLGYKPTKLTKKGNPQIDEESLIEAAETLSTPELKLMADWLVNFGRGNMVETWLKFVNHEDSRMHGKIFTCGALSRRMIHTNPNTANIPSIEARYGYECRNLWQATPGEWLCGYDAKALQMRIFGHYLGDIQTARLYIEGDPHTANSESIGNGVGRKSAKNLFYAFIFGAQNPKLGRMVGRDKKFGSYIRDRLYASTPGLQALVEQAQAEFHQNGGRLKCLDGGYVRCPSEHAALNYYVQPGEVCIMKQAAIILDSKLRKSGIEHKKVGDIHDEGIHEIHSEKEADEVGKLSQEALKESGETFNLIVPIEGDYRVGKTWAETH